MKKTKPVGKCQVNIHNKPPYICGKTSYHKLCGLPVCDDHYLEAKKRVTKPRKSLKQKKKKSRK